MIEVLTAARHLNGPLSLGVLSLCVEDHALAEGQYHVEYVAIALRYSVDLTYVRQLLFFLEVVVHQAPDERSLN